MRCCLWRDCEGLDYPCTSAHIALYNVMVTVYREARWKVSIYARDHGVPHFHIEGPGFRCSVAIRTNDVIIGAVPPKILREVLNWAQGNRALLLKTWQELNG